MIGYAKIDIKKIKEWISSEKAKLVDKKDNRNKCWYDLLWHDYFYGKQEFFKNAEPVLKVESYGSVRDRSDEFLKLTAILDAEDQKLMVFYHDETAVIVGYQNHRYILPAELIELESLKDYSHLTAAELTAIGDKQMTDAMLPADMGGYSIKSLEEELDEKKQEIHAAEEKCKQAIEKIREEALQRERELRELLEKETESLNAMKKDLENKIYVLDTQIYGIRCYLGEVVNFTQIRSGKAADSDVPIVLFQKFRFLDEEMGKYLSLYTFGAYEGDNDTLMGALKARDDLRDTFCPADRCIVVLKNSRTGKAVKTSSAVTNMLEQYDYLHGKQIAVLVRDGENLYIGWTDEERVNISSEDMFLKPGKVTESMVSDRKDTYFSEISAEKYEQERIKKEREQRVSRFFLISIIQGMIDKGGLINIPKKTRITEESDLVKFAFAEGWLKDTTYGTFDDILKKSEHIEMKKGEIVLTGMHVTRDDARSYSDRYRSQYMEYSNNRGIGAKNRTHGAYIPEFEFMPINKILKKAVVNVTFQLFKGKPVVNPKYYFPYDNSKAYDVVMDESEEVLGTYTHKFHLSEDDFNAAGSVNNIEKVIMAKYNGYPLWHVDEEGELEAYIGYKKRYDSIPDLTKFGIPKILNIDVLSEEILTYVSVPMEYGTGSRVNFEIMPDEYVRTSYLCSKWIKYVITTGNVGSFSIGGTRMNYAETLKYLNTLLVHIREREEEEEKLLVEAGGKEYVESNKEWSLELCEWRIKNKIPVLTKRSARKFIKEVL